MGAETDVAADLVRLTYEGVLRKEAWGEMLALACRALRAQDAYLGSIPVGASGPRLVLTHGVDPKVAETYSEQWVAPPKNPILTLLIPKGFRGVLEPRKVLPRSRFERTEFYEVCRRPRGVDAELGCGDVGAGGRIRFLTVNRATGDPDFGESERQLMSLLNPHFLKALEVDALLAAERTRSACLGCAVDNLDDPVVRRDPDGRLHPLNPAGESFLRSEGIGTWDGHALVVRDPRPSPQSPAPTAAGAGIERTLRSGRTWRIFSVPFFESDRFVGEVLRLRLVQPCFFASVTLPGEAGLTPHETSVATLLCEGLSTVEICTRLDISTNTLNTHVRHILGKTGLRSRTQLVARLGHSPEDRAGQERFHEEVAYRD